MMPKTPGLWRDMVAVIRRRKAVFAIHTAIPVAGGALFGETWAEALFYAMPGLVGIGLGTVFLALSRRRGWFEGLD